MNKIQILLDSLFDFYLRFPLFTISGIFMVMAIIAFFINWEIALGCFFFALITFIGQIFENRS